MLEDRKKMVTAECVAKEFSTKQASVEFPEIKGSGGAAGDSLIIRPNLSRCRRSGIIIREAWVRSSFMSKGEKNEDLRGEFVVRRH